MPKTVKGIQWGEIYRVGFVMKSLFLKGCLVLPLFLAGCDGKKEEEEVDYDRMVKNEEECEWTSGPESGGGHIAGDLYPEPQEVIIEEAIDAPSRLDSSTIR